MIASLDVPVELGEALTEGDEGIHRILLDGNLQWGHGLGTGF